MHFFLNDFLKIVLNANIKYDGHDFKLIPSQVLKN